MGKITDVRSVRKTRFGSVHRQFLVYWKGYTNHSWVDEADIKCGALLLDFDRTRASRNRLKQCNYAKKDHRINKRADLNCGSYRLKCDRIRDIETTCKWLCDRMEECMCDVYGD